MSEDTREHDHDAELKKHALRNVRDLVDRIERDDIGWQGEKQMLLVLGLLALAIVGFVGLAMMMGPSRSKDLERFQCEQDFQTKGVIEYSESLKAEPGVDPAEAARRLQDKRTQLKAAAKEACAKK